MTRRILVIVAALVFATPALAVVDFNAVQDANKYVVSITYSGELVRAIALDITVDNNTTIARIDSYKTGESTAASPGFGIFPGRFRDYIDAANPNWADPNYTPVAPAGDPDAEGGIGTNGVTIELGSLYVGEPNKPATSGTLCKLLVSTASATCNMTIAANATRGNVVKEDANEATTNLPKVVVLSFTVAVPDVLNQTKTDANNLITGAGLVVGVVDYNWSATYAKGRVMAQNPAGGQQVPGGSPVNYTLSQGAVPVACFDPCGTAWSQQKAQYNSYITKKWDPNCWCSYPVGSGFQCHGDADGKKNPDGYRVFTGDLGLVTSNWKKKLSTFPLGANPCADLDHKANPDGYRVFTADLARVTTNWKRKDSPAVGGLPRNCPINDANNNVYVKP
jgi:hypothetical protein